jgi:DNA repair/transcription protein MET18/MMS19
MVEYLCTRLENKDKLPSFRAGTRETTTALQSLTKYSTFPPGDAATTVLAVFALSNDSNNLFKDLTHNTRLELYMLIDILIKKYEKATRRDVKNQDLVEGIVSMGLAEKNPSCLSVLFPLYAYISRHWTLESAELDRIWESYIRYFPITVGGAVGDPSAPTKEKMRDLLLDCIVSNDHYGAKAFERLIEMLDTESDLSATTKVVFL